MVHATPQTLVIRVLLGTSGSLSGTVQRVTTGEKVWFSRAQDIADVVARLLVRAEEPPQGRESE